MPRRTGGRLGALLVAHMATGRSRNVGIGAVPNSWLFPATYLGGRSPPLISANVSARSGSMLGVAIATAVAWVHAAGGDWANYAALVTEDNPQC